MGHRHTPAQFGGHGGVRAAYSGAARPAPLDADTGSRPALTRARSLGASFLLAAIRFYQVCLSPFLGSACKFYPSCSRYAAEAVERHGARRGAALAAKRLLRCRPFSAGGYDPVPESEESAS